MTASILERVKRNLPRLALGVIAYVLVRAFLTGSGVRPWQATVVALIAMLLLIEAITRMRPPDTGD